MAVCRSCTEEASLLDGEWEDDSQPAQSAPHASGSWPGCGPPHADSLRWHHAVRCGLQSHRCLLQRGEKKTESNCFDTLFAQKVCICTREINYLNVCVYNIDTEGFKCVQQTQIQSNGEPPPPSSPLLPRLKAQAGDKVEETERTSVQNDLSTTWHARQAQYILTIKN